MDLEPKELTYDTPDTFLIEGVDNPNHMLQGGLCKTVIAGTTIELTPNFPEDYLLLRLCLTVEGADDVLITVRSVRQRGNGRRYPVIAKDRVRCCLCRGLCHSADGGIGLLNRVQ